MKNEHNKLENTIQKDGQNCMTKITTHINVNTLHLHKCNSSS